MVMGSVRSVPRRSIGLIVDLIDWLMACGCLAYRKIRSDGFMQ
jgi:hypothetical protein